MKNRQAVVEQIVQNLAFEVEAVPIERSDRTIRTTSISQSTPLNVKIRVRKKDETQLQHDVSSVIDEPIKGLQKIRLVSSDQTIMTFDVFMEAEFEKKPSRKPRKHIFDIIKPGLCLGAVDDDEYPYMPSSSYSAKITEPTVITRSDGVLKQKFTLSKNNYEHYPVSHNSDGQKWLFGKCKPGGCLDPPFSEDKYSYKPTANTEQEQLVSEPNVLRTGNLGDEDIKRDDKSNGRHSSIFDGGLFRKRRKSSDKSTNTLDVKENEDDSILSIYQVESTVNSLSTHSNNSIITYPHKRSNENNSKVEKTLRSRGPSEDKSRKSFNDHSEPYFIPPKGFNRLKEKDLLNHKDYSEHRPSDVSDIKNKSKEYLKMPMPLPIPIPIPIPIVSDQHKPEDGNVNIDITKKKVDDEIISETKSSLDKINGSQIPERHSKTVQSTDNIDHNPIESLKSPLAVPFNDGSFKGQSTTIVDDTIDLNISEQHLSKIKEQQDNDMDDKCSSNGTGIPKQVIEKEPRVIPIPIPITFSGSKSERVSTNTDTMDLSAQNNNISMSKINRSEQLLLGTNMSTEELKVALLEDSKIIQKDVSSRKKSREKESTLKPLTTNTQSSESNDKETKADPNNYLRTQSETFNEGSDIIENENIIIKEPSMQGDIRRDSKDKKITDELLKPTKEQEEDQEIEVIDTTTEKYLEKMSNENELTSPDNKPDPDLFQNDVPKRTSQLYFPVPQTTDPAIKKTATSAASIKDSKIKNSGDSPNINKKSHSADTLKDELKKTLRSGLEDEIDGIIGKESPLCYDKENVAGSTKLHRKTKLNNEDDVSSFSGSSRFTNNESLNFITAPVIIDPTEQIPQFGQLKQICSETNLVAEPVIPSYQIYPDIFEKTLVSRFKADDDGTVTHSTVSHELIGNKSVIYDLDDFLPSTASVKPSEKPASTDKRVVLRGDTDKGNTEITTKSPRISNEANISSDDLRNKLTNKSNARSISVLSSTSTLKSALKKDKITVELAFQSYLNDKNERVLRTFDAANKPKRMPNDSVTVIKSQVKLSTNEIRIPVDSDHDMSIQIKKPNTNQRVSLSESTFENGHIKQNKAAVQDIGDEIRSSGSKGYNKKIESENVIDSSVIDLYEQELVPLQMIIKKLRDEIDVLAAQQLMFRDKIFCPKKSKLPRLVHTNKKCIGCLRKP